MNGDTPHPNACNEKYEELCALATSGELSVSESAQLYKHVAVCNSCATLLREYASLANTGMARLAPAFEPESQNLDPDREQSAEKRLISAIRAKKFDERMGLYTPGYAVGRFAYWKRNRHTVLWVGAAAVLLICVGGTFELGRKTEPRLPQISSLSVARPPAAVPDIEKANLHEKLAGAQKALDEVTARSIEAEKQIKELSRIRALLLKQMDELTRRDQATSDSLVALTQQRDDLQRQLNDASKSLEQVKKDLNQAEQDRQGAVLRIAGLEEEVNGLHAVLTVTDKTASANEQFLSQDRDIRELMGARQLYIADVFDVQNNGQRSRPFGRVFYTKGKSLIFYAFDLQSQAGYREARAFQAWGKPDDPSAKPISLGIFYEDSEANRRWIVKSDNPDVLAQINAVFVTVEPRGGSQHPTSKPFLEAYLHSLPPNHP